MKRISFFISVFIIFFIYPSLSISNPNDSLSTLINTVIKNVNSRATPIDKVHSEADINIKTSTMDQNGFIEIKLQRANDFWFRIWGKFAFISKDAFIAHFNRKNFIYLNNHDDK